MNACQSILSNIGEVPENGRGEKKECKRNPVQHLKAERTSSPHPTPAPFPVHGWTSEHDTWAPSETQSRLRVTHNSGFLQLRWTHWLLYKKNKKNKNAGWNVYEVLIGLTHLRLLLLDYFCPSVSPLWISGNLNKQLYRDM